MDLVDHQYTGFPDGREVPEWDEIDILVQKGYAALEQGQRQYEVMTKNWLEKEPHNVDAINAKSLCLAACGK